mgnify:FL=1
MALNYRMHKYNKLFFSVLIFLAACQGSKAPKGIINKERMIGLLTEIHIVDGSLYSVMQLPDTLHKYGMDKYIAMFKKYHTDSAQFRKSFKYYSANPDMMQSIYEQITANIKFKSDSVNKLNEKQIQKDNKRRLDSLNKLPKQKPNQVTPAQPSPAVKPKFLKGHAVPVK